MNKTTGASRGLRIALSVSLAINLLVLGLVAGGIYRHASGSDRLDKHHKRYGAAYIRALPSEDRKAIRKALRQRAASDAFKQKQIALVVVLRAEPFDIARVTEILDQQRKGAVVAQQKVEQLWLERIAQMSAQDRSSYADRLELELSRKSFRKRSKRHD